MVSQRQAQAFQLSQEAVAPDSTHLPEERKAGKPSSWDEQNGRCALDQQKKDEKFL
jgi:hypothetical protein